MTSQQLQARYDALIAHGFDLSHVSTARSTRIGCSQCEALAINGVATHETGCPNAVHECHGCNALVLMRVRYCGDCQ